MDALKLNIDKKELKNLEKRINWVLFDNILPFWLKYSRDEEKGGFWGRVSNENVPLRDAPKGLILYSRILWTFSVLYQRFGEPAYLEMAERAWQYLDRYFWDEKYGGMFWLVDANGTVMDDKKKMYGQAFTIYALSAFYRIYNQPAILQKAIDLFELMLKHNYDKQFGGFLETSGRDWTLVLDMRLSDQDLNSAKSMNTHLHIMEAFTGFYQIWPESVLRKQLRSVMEILIQKIFNPQTGHLNLFFKENWQSESKAVSFGHDIETSWLLQETFMMLHDSELEQPGREVALKLAKSTLMEGLTPNYAIYKERTDEGMLVPILEWWQQAEATVGFAYAYLLSGRPEFWKAMVNTWQFLEEYLLNREYGEWYYGVDSKGRPNLNTYKVSEWKGPYHNVRACLELLKCLEKLRSTHNELVSK